ncbi:MAG: signal peptidase II [Bdellovibrionota bacterium]
MVPRKYLIMLALSGMLTAFDQLFKFIVISRFRIGESLEVTHNFFNITRVHNAGAAFGLLATLGPSWREPFFFVVPIAMLAVIFVVFYRLQESQHLGIFSLSLIVGGALGNLADRVRLGYVVDFLDFHWQNGMHFPAFNIADTAISLGVFLLVVSMFVESGKESPDTAKAG